MPEVSLKELIATGAHFGHQSRRWNPKMKNFLYGVKDGVHIFDLLKTKEKLQEALEVLRKASSEGKTILLVGTKKQAKDIVREIAKEADVYFVTERWLGGTLTNFEQIRRSCQKLVDLKAGMEKGEYRQRTKKERLLIQREIDRLERFFGGIVDMKKLADLIVIIDIRREKTAVKEADEVGIDTIGIVDSNSDPTLVTYPIPMNDDASRALEYVLKLTKKAILEGKKGKTKDVKRKTN